MRKWLLVLGLLTLSNRATVLLFVASHCPCSDPHRLLVQSLVHDYQRQGVKFYAIFSNRGETKELTGRFMHQTGWKFPWIIDRDGVLKERYQASLTPEAFLLDAKGKVVYRGAIDDSVPNLGQIQNPYLKTALVQLLERKTIDPKSTPPYGCYIVR